MQRIIVVFKTHFDYGYTDLARNVWSQYRDHYIPKALALAAELRNTADRFIWTTGAWMIHQYLSEANDAHRENMEEAIYAGDIRWHGLPFTTHTEVMDRALFSDALSLAQELNKRFAHHTIAAKMTDVPGHTIAMVPLLAEAGIRFLHIGTNPVSAVPKVPELFEWQTSRGDSVVVMYSFGYGDFQEIGDSGVALMFAHSGDNNGPPTKRQVQDIYRDLRRRYPSADICAGDLNDVAHVALRLRGRLPVLTKEIGDSWIHGIASDPRKIAGYRELLRLRSSLPEPERSRVDRGLLLIPEHTWGLDYKSRAKDHLHFEKDAFHTLRKNGFFSEMVHSWEEQREYLVAAAQAFPPQLQERARTAAKGKHAALNILEEGMRVVPDEVVRCYGHEAAIDANGSITHLVLNGQLVAGAAHPMAIFRYEAFSRAETDRYVTQYMDCSKFPHLEELAREDFNKLGTETAIAHFESSGSTLTDLLWEGHTLQATMTPTHEQIAQLYGCPRRLVLQLHFHPDHIEIAFAWSQKDATRVPEAIWLGFKALGNQGVLIRKLGEWVDPLQVVSRGGRSLHGTDGAVRMGDLLVEPQDSALVAPGAPSLWNFDDAIPDPREGCWFCLYNNQWNTNFPLWYAEDAPFRFTLRWDDQEKRLPINQ